MQAPVTNPPVAIVGVGCRFPGGANDPESFWSLLMEGRSGIREVPLDRWNLARYYDPDPGAVGTMVTKWGGFVDGLDAFDAHFWSVSPREAMRMDPQQRWLLEVAWEAIEDSGVAPSRLRGERVGVFVGISATDYGGVQLPNLEGIDAYTNSGSTLSIASNRISYMLDLKGPSLSVDTACSSSAVAVWLACRSLWAGECVAALVGGVNAIITPHATVGFSKAAMVSRSGQCFAFDARANGYVRGEGAGVVYLKPLAAALVDGDRIYAVIRGAAVNQDGHTSSMTVPSVEGQTAMLREAYAQAGVPPNRVAYVEAHGTGTPVGDPIEATALGRVLGEGRPSGTPCPIGSVKTNIGHLEAGSGIAGLIKAALVLHKRMIPPSRNFETPNPNIPFETLRLRVAAGEQPLVALDGAPPVVGVNSFGFGGTNAHVVLEAAPPSAPDPPAIEPRAVRPCVLPISARDEAALGRAVDAHRELVRAMQPTLSDVCAAAGARREHHAQRLAVIGRSIAEVDRRLAAWRRDGTAAGVVAGRGGASAPLAFVFTGQGAQWWGMGRQLLEREPVVRQTIEEIDAHLRPLTGWSLREEMLRPSSESRLERTDVAQPAIFALQAALVELWKSWGITPAAVIGHSVGEVAAAHTIGAYTLAEAAELIAHRSRLQHKTLGTGHMAVVAASPDEARRAFEETGGAVDLAAINSPQLVTLAGDAEALQGVTARFERAGVFTRWLRIPYAFHSRFMDPIREPLLQALAGLRPRSSTIPFVSTVTGMPLDTRWLDADYWWDNVRRPVLLAPAIMELIREHAYTFLEIGPHPALESPIQESMAAAGRSGAVLHSLRRGTDDSNELLTNLARLHVLGVDVDWRAVNQSSAPRIRLPRYPWGRESFWLESGSAAQDRLAAFAHPLLGQRVDAPRPTWQRTLDLRRLEYLEDHRVWEGVVFPAAGYVEIGLALARLLFPHERHAVEDLQIHRALFVSDAGPPKIQVVFDPEDKGFGVYSSAAEHGAWELHAVGTLRRLAPEPRPRVDLGALRARLVERFDRERFQHELAIRGYEFGPSFRLTQNLWRVPGEALTEIEGLESFRPEEYAFHPALLDACIQSFLGTRVAGADARPEDDLFLPESIRSIRLHRQSPPRRLWAHARLTAEDSRSLLADITVYDDAGQSVADLVGVRFVRAEPKRAGTHLEDCWYRFAWEPRRLRGSNVDGPCGFPAAEDLEAALRVELPGLAARHALDAYHRDYAPRARAAAAQLIASALVELGWAPHVGDALQLTALVRDLGIAPEHQRLTRSFLRDMARQGWLRATGDDGWAVVETPRVAESDAVLTALAADHPEAAAEIALLRRVGPSLAAVLTGDADPIALLFPGGVSALLDRYYAEAAAFPAHLELMSIAVAKAVATLPVRRALRVLEVGAGTGALTRVLLPLLPADRTEYRFTDIGASFVAAARARFADVPWVEYQTLDLEQDPISQGIAPGSFDLVVAGDVVHATADVRRTLSGLRACLADGGRLLLLEWITRDFGRDNLIFGLLKGWWQFSDAALRKDSPLLDGRQWRRVLTASGFADVVCVDCAPPGAAAEHAILMATAAGTTSHGTASATPKRYLVLADEQGVGDALAKRLEGLGHRSIVLRRSGMEQVDGAVASPDVDAVIDCDSLDHPRADCMDLDALRSAQQRGSLSAFRLLRALADRPTPVWFATRNAQRVRPDDPTDGLASSPLVGLVRVASNERSGRVALVDLDACAPEEAAEYLAAEITLPADGEMETAYRCGTRYALRLHAVRPDEVPKRRRDAVRADGAVTPYRLQIDRPGALAHLALHETPRRAPGPNEIEIRVHAGGINFRDVMKALGTHPGHPEDARWFGDDLAGVVERVGEQVRNVRAGDRVTGVAPYAFRSYAITDPRMVLRMPPAMSFAEAATVPTVFLTAHYALEHLTRMRPGERILIHAATGGVGQAAIQVARHLGLEVFATAGTPEKRRLLTEMGVRHVLDSRTLRFADEIMELTGDQGVDAVLNSLAGDFIAKSVAVLAPFGRFIEIGKVDVYRNSKLGLQSLRDNISYFVVDLLQLMRARPAFVQQMLGEIAERFAAGHYRPIPYSRFPITEAVEAFRFMAQGKHVGKNVLEFDLDHIPIGPCTEPARRFRADASYLITGGAGGVGLEVAKWLVRGGARHLILMSRSGPPDAAARADLEGLCGAGVTVVDARGDVTRRADVDRVLENVAASGRPLRGVFHAAMVLDDDALGALDEARFERVVEPKMAGAWNLHLATREHELDHFVCFSSFSVVCGAPRQANYDAGNAFLDALAHYRHHAGLPALTIDWGAIVGAGFVERNAKAADYLNRAGLKPFRVAEAVEILGQLLLLDPVQIVAARVDWTSLASFVPLVSSSNTYASVARDPQRAERGRSLAARLAASSAQERTTVVEDFIVAQVGEVFGIAGTKVDRQAPLTSLGLDSLMTVELVNRMESLAGIRIPMGALFSGPSVEELARTVLRLLEPARDSPDDATTAVPTPVTAAGVQLETGDRGHVVAIRTTGSSPPLIMFHPVGGGITIYAPLARQLADDVPLYGIESRLMRGAEREFADVDSMVSAYVAAVREVAPPPYRLFGFSLGGYLATRVAEALEQASAAVALVGVVEWDARPRLTQETQAAALLRLSMVTYRFLEQEIGAVRSLTDSRLRLELGALVEQVVRDGPDRSDLFLRWSVDSGLIVGDAMQRWARQYLAAFGQHCALLASDLRVPRFRAPLALWRASAGFGSPLESWQHQGAAIEHVADGDHFAFLRSPGVSVLAKQLGGILQSAPPTIGAPSRR
jgi:acyl transferase domain-containing protein/NADPH:quinone reductase-like Zn-dependent oxidoreductase/thioesterase domain-containing protein/SAM-dependent methyltransferase/acyl carrier protein